MMIPLNDLKMSRVSSGGDFTLAADEEGAIFVWGKKTITQNFPSLPNAAKTRASLANNDRNSFVQSGGGGGGGGGGGDSSGVGGDEKPFVRCADRTTGKKVKAMASDLCSRFGKLPVLRFVDVYSSVPLLISIVSRESDCKDSEKYNCRMLYLYCRQNTPVFLNKTVDFCAVL